MGAQAPCSSPLSPRARGECPWEEGPGRKPPRERPKALTPARSPSARRLVRLSEGAPGLRARLPLRRALETPHLLIPGFFALSAHSLSKRQDGDRANLQSAVVFRKTVHTLNSPAAAPGRPLPVTVKTQRGSGRRSGSAWSGRRGFRLLRAQPPATGREVAVGQEHCPIAQSRAHAAPPAAVDGWETAICL